MTTVPRDAEGVPCQCGGYADRVTPNAAEMAKFNCHRTYECCARAFVCRVCKTRFGATAEAPDW